MNLLPGMPEIDLFFPTQPQEQVPGFNEVRNSGSFASTLEALDQGESDLRDNEISDEALEDTINTSGTEGSVESRETSDREEQRIEAKPSDEPGDDAALPLFQAVGPMSEVPEPLLLVSDQNTELGQETPPAAQLPKTGLSLDLSLKVQEGDETLTEIAMTEEAAGISLDSLDEALKAEVSGLKNVDVPKTASSKLDAGKLGSLDAEAVTSIQSEHADDTTTGSNSDQTGDALPLKSLSEAATYDTVEESLSGDLQAADSQEGFDQGKGAQQDRSTLVDDLLKVSSVAQSGNRDASLSSEASSRPVLALSEKAAILSQLTAQFRGLQAGKVEQLRLQLHPESLGALQVELSLQKGSLVAHILTADPRVKDLLESNQALLRQSLAEQGFDVDGFSVDVGDTESSFKGQERAQVFREGRWLEMESEDPVSGILNPELLMQTQGRINVYV